MRGGARVRSGPPSLRPCLLDCLLALLSFACFDLLSFADTRATVLYGATHFPTATATTTRLNTLSLESAGESNTSFGNTHTSLFPSFRKGDKNGVREGVGGGEGGGGPSPDAVTRSFQIQFFHHRCEIESRCSPPRSRGDGGREGRGKAGQVFLFRGKNRGRE